MEAERPRRQFSLAVQTYLWLFFALLGFIPVLILNAVADKVPLPLACWIAAWKWPVVIAMLFLYAQRRCSGDSLNFRDGLLWVTASVMTDWTYLSFATVLPALTAAFFGSVLVAFMGDVRRDPRYPTQKWLLIVRFF